MNKKKIIVVKNKPLPPELGKEWEENLAKLILKHYRPKLFSNLTDGEKPDLRDNENSIGVEVTVAESEASRELDSLYSRPYTHGNEEQRKKALIRIEELGGRVKSGVLYHPSRSCNLNLVYDAIKRKTAKLGHNYSLFNKNYLFIFSSMDVDEGDMHHVLDIVRKNAMPNGGGPSFDAVFVYYLGGELYEFDLVHNNVKSIQIETEVHFKLSNEARAIIESKYDTIS